MDDYFDHGYDEQNGRWSPCYGTKARDYINWENT